MVDLVWFLLVLPLATWRVTHILTKPERIAGFIHNRLGRVPDIYTGQFTYPDTMVAYLFQCYYCMSVWVGLFMVVAWVICPYILLPFAASALTIFIEEKR